MPKLTASHTPAAENEVKLVEPQENPNPTGKAGHFSIDTSKPWICPACKTDLNQARDNEENAEIVRRVRG